MNLVDRRMREFLSRTNRNRKKDKVNTHSHLVLFFVFMCDFIFRSFNHNVCFTGFGQQPLHERFAQYDLEWEKVLPPARARKLGSQTSEQLGNGTFEVAAELATCLKKVENGSCWRYESNSCHIDTWLMVELSFFSTLTSETNLLTDDIVLQSETLTKLFKVLLGVGSNDQDVFKMAYWAMEIEVYEGGSSNARLNFRKQVDYMRHPSYFTSRLNDHCNLDLAGTTIGHAPQCNNPNHVPKPMTKKAGTGLGMNVRENWYSLPDAWNRTQDIDKKWHISKIHFHAHKSMQDVMGTLLGRTDGETTECSECFKNTGGSYQITWHKDPSLSLLPLSLEFELDPSLKVHAEELLTIGGIEYRLLAVVFGDGNHFKCNVNLGNKWYHYDCTGILTRSLLNPSDSVPVPLIMPFGDRYMEPPRPVGDYKPIAYRYLRKNATTLDPTPMTDVSSLPSDLQFNNMWRLL